MEERTIGARVEHERYGEGIISKVGLSNYSVIFVRGGEMQFSKSNEEITLLEKGTEEGDTSGLTWEDVENALIAILEKYHGLQREVELGSKWTGGTLVLRPGNTSLQEKEIPIEAFFRKIVTLRDRLRVLEQNINSHHKLDDEDKVHLQQYISRAYGSLTTFNVLFLHKEDQFSSKK